MIIGRGALGWQTIVADLALILFMITASALHEDDTAVAKAAAATVPSLTKWRAEHGGQSFAQWVADLPADPRATLVINARYSPAHREQTWAAARVRENIAKARFARVRTELLAADRTSLSAEIVYDGQQAS